MHNEISNITKGLHLSKNRTILAIHLHHEDRVDEFFRKVKLLLEVESEIWVSSANKELLQKVASMNILRSKVMKIFEVDNKWHDWSGYLAFLREIEPSFRLIVCNDSIVTRRVISKNTIRRFIKALEMDRPAIIGELDTAKCSIDIGGWSSASWISTYLFAIKGLHFDVPQLVDCVENDLEKVLTNSDHFFIRYLDDRRTDVVIDSDSKLSKLGAMFFERRLTRLAIENGLQIVDSCAGSTVRKFERVLERFRDA